MELNSKVRVINVLESQEELNKNVSTFSLAKEN